MSTDHYNCNCVWVANGGRGGEPDFRPNRQMWHGVKMYVRCERCGCRTWMSPETWDALPVEGERLTRRHRRRLERMGITEWKRLVPALPADLVMREARARYDAPPDHLKRPGDLGVALPDTSEEGAGE